MLRSSAMPAPAPCRPLAEGTAARARRLRWLLLDVDGVLTDGRLWYGADGAVAKAFDVKDGLGIELARAAGLRVGLLTGRSDAATDARARELGMDLVLRGRGDKREAFAAFLAEQGVAAEEVAYVGDDLPDLPVLAQCGLGAAPADAVEAVRRAAAVVLTRRGGRGAVRELVELILLWRGEGARLAAEP